ncbi:hypothetical protein HYE67_011197 [Fusarium culmorum]|uniref:Uncharacterized protein n=1 Tax=Fusarium culmorum TaxID=5516 RepID=A0A7S8I0X0_FUSCU|nr:hypothetical protein HYE67_011197 [Fusarium culmorum]
MGITNDELKYLLNGSFTEATLDKLILMSDQDCKTWNGNPLFRQFQTNVVGTSVGHWKAPKHIQEWATSVLMEHLEDQDIEKEAAAKRAAAAKADEEAAAARKADAEKKKADKLAIEMEASAVRDDARRAAKAAAAKQAAAAAADKASLQAFARAANEALAREYTKKSANCVASDIYFEGDDLIAFD